MSDSLHLQLERLRSLGRSPEALATAEALAADLARQGQPLRAITVCRTLLQLEPAHVRTPQLLADLYAKPGTSGGAPPPGARAVPLFSQLTREPFMALVGVVEPRFFKPGESLIVEGEPGRSSFVLVEGRVDVVRQMDGGEKRTLSSLGEGEFFGEIALVSESPRLASVVATEPVVALELHRTRVERVALKHSTLSETVQSFYRERLLANVLRSHPIFATLAPEQRQALAHIFELRTVEAGRVIIEQGQKGDGLYLMLQGQCTPLFRRPDGRETAFAPLREGDVFGEISLLLGQPASATVRAETACHLLRLGREAFEQYLAKQPGVRAALMRVGTERLLQLSKVLASGRSVHQGDQRV
ncbi:cyclic nucleotide-binding domain-containing protein [Vitiosangium sp. GDMCC 1.1324]|uniref:cyclic nucleotide-binding domain-containing protein n=1 Tax=Vitiosangium sp. (strain GDMCC 1.1324) TaxID=2138576 RepID=UPI000D346BC5|nr:cyclic nucleotide-binding domain-containing protein [Vitiosangium sp. GDMCC 1.1324]PTL80667.1 cyclic nucleotide-binding protein [Vitiosangium sp. GDMCC 1.1324]